MKAPGFWQRRGVVSTLLLPLAWLYALIGWLRGHLIAPQEVAIPVLCIGNAVAGGAGKTPVALAVAELLKQQKKAVHFLSRGYSGKPQTAPTRVTSNHTAAEIGDEPLLLSRIAPCWVSANRVAAAQAAIAAGADLLLLDDGLQNPALKKTLSFLVVDGEVGFGNGRIIPAGPLREPLASAFAKVQAVILVGKDRVGAVTQIPAALPIFRGRLMPLHPLDQLPQPIFAFAGLGRPEKFFTMLKEGGVNVVGTRSFPDHHSYTEADREALRQQAAKLGAHLVTTAKDAVKWPQREGITVVEVAFQFEDSAGFSHFLQEQLHAAS